MVIDCRGLEKRAIADLHVQCVCVCVCVCVYYVTWGESTCPVQ